MNSLYKKSEKNTPKSSHKEKTYLEVTCTQYTALICGTYSTAKFQEPVALIYE
jgi:hypothetical protein